MEKVKERLKSIMSSDRARRVIILVAVISVGLIFISGQIPSNSRSKRAEEPDLESYRTVLTEDITSMVKSVEGVGEAKILLTLENSYEYIYLADNKTLQKINEPRVRGVVVACEGGGSAVIAEKITDLLVTALDIPAAKVCITKLT